jgi:calpain-15
LDNAQVKAKNLKWKHYTQLTTIKNPQLFQDGIDPNDILQGGLGNCYFLSALACLAEYPNLIQRLFEYADIETGYFLIWLCIDGAWKLYEIDGNIVVNPQGDQPYFTRSKQGELWVVLIEKAYAKAYGSFENIIGGDAGSAIRDLTGSPNKYFDHTKVK